MSSLTTSKPLKICNGDYYSELSLDVTKYTNTLPLIIRLVRDPRATFKQSISVLEHAKKYKPTLVTKTSIMLGLGETDEQIQHAMQGYLTNALHVNVCVTVMYR